MRTTWVSIITGAALLVGACSYQHNGTGLSPSTPSSTPAQTTPAGPSYLGTWATAAAPTEALNPSTCGNLQWAVSSQSSSQIAGTFSANCAGGITLSGTARGQLGDLTNIPVTIEGTGSGPNLPSCSFSVSGTGSIQENGNALQIVYSGTTCQGPVRGTETLRKKVTPAPTPSPSPTPTPTPTPTPAPAPAPDPGLDQMNLGSAVVYNSPPDVASWPITTRITRLEMLGCNGGVALQFAAQNTWPDYTPPGWDGPLQYTVWAGVKVNGVWTMSGFIQFWRGRDNTGAPILPMSCGFPVNWAYDGRWGTLNGYRPSVGEQWAFFVTAGDARNMTGVTSLRERSNVVVVNLPPDTGLWTW
jgi:hypothetical protein